MIMTKTTTSMLFPEIRGSIESMTYPAYVQVKLDGEADYLIYSSKGSKSKIKLRNKYGTERTEGLLNDYNMEGVESMTLIGELIYQHGRLGDLYELLKNKDNDDVLRYIAFDVLEINGTDVSSLSTEERLEIMLEICSKTQIPCVRSKIVEDKSEVIKMFEEVTAAGFEGLVVKPINTPFTTGPCSWVKMKHKDQSEFKVTYIDPSKERIEVEVITPTVTKTVGCKVTNKDKAKLKVGDMVTIEHQGVLSGGGLRHPAFKGKV